jgi:hypothetical protein
LENSFNDTYLTEVFTQKKDKPSCTTKCSKFSSQNKKIRQLRVMKPVCECKYERKIVKRNEDRKKWFDRQDRLKSLKKEPFMHITDISMSELSDPDLMEAQNSDSSDIAIKYCQGKKSVKTKTVPPQTVISAVTMQTPVVTPVSSRSDSNELDMTLNDSISEITRSLANTVVKSQEKSTSNKKIMKDNKNNFASEANELTNTYEKRGTKDELEDSNIFENSNNVIEHRTTMKIKKNSNFYDNLENQLKAQIRVSLAKCTNNNMNICLNYLK